MEDRIGVFEEYAEKYDFDWLMLAAQAFQESRFRHGRRSPAGAVGVMQIKPSTAADRNVGITDISSIDNNVRAGAKYLRFLIDRYFTDDGIDELNRWFFGLAAYNAGPATVQRYNGDVPYRETRDYVRRVLAGMGATEPSSA